MAQQLYGLAPTYGVEVGWVHAGAMGALLQMPILWPSYGQGIPLDAQEAPKGLVLA